MSPKRPKILRARRGIDWSPLKETVSLLGGKETFPQFFTFFGLPETPYKEWIDFGPDDKEKFGLQENSVEGSYIYRHQRTGFRVICLLFPEIKRNSVFGALKKVYRKGELVDTLFALSKADFSEVWLALPIPQDKRMEVRALPLDINNPKISILETLDETQRSLKKLFEHNKEFSSFEILKILWDRFNRAPVTERFYQDLVVQSKEIEGATKTKIELERDRRRFSLLLLTRIMFTYFLQKKRWIEGKEEILSEFLQKSGDEKEVTFYEKYLKTLFFQVLNERHERRTGLAKEFKFTPYLNGGLFNETDLDLRYRDVTIPNQIFSSLFEKLLDKYRFIVTEETPEFTTVSVDPEILGGVFEEIIQGKERKEEGAYYTPKEVVLFMTRNALFFWLRKKVKVDEDRLLRLIFDDDNEGLTKDDKEGIFSFIKEVKVIDPAVGSGAFLQGMLLELERLRKRLGENKNDLERRKEIIRDNLHGVDIDDIATWLCELRLWLNLVETMDGDIKDILPLPNLDHKVKKGDSLLQEVMDLRGYLPPRELVSELETLEATYLEGGEEARKIVEEIKRVREELINWYIQNYGFKKLGEKAGFHWEIDFPGIFTQGGFDIAIMNPPYVRQEDIGKHEFFDPDYKSGLLKNYKTPGRSDLYVYFYHRLKDLLKEDSVAVMVSSNSWLDVHYGKNLQKFLLQDFHFPIGYESETERWFGAAVNTNIFVLQKGTAKDTTNFVSFRGSLRDYIITGEKRLSEIVKGILTGEGESIGPGFLYQEQDFRSYRVERDTLLKEPKWGKFLRAPKVFWKILDRGKDKLVPLKELAEVRFGIKTGANEFFYVKNITEDIEEKVLLEEFGYVKDGLKREGLRVIESGEGSRHLVEEEYLKPVIKSPREIEGIIVDPQKLKYKVLMVHESKRALSGKKVHEYIEWGERQGYHKRPTCKSRKRWWDLREYVSNIIWQVNVRDRFIVAKRKQDEYIDKMFYLIRPYEHQDETCLLMYLNSTISRLILETTSLSMTGQSTLAVFTVEDLEDTVALDIRGMSEILTTRMNSILSKLARRSILSVFAEISQADRRQLDSIILEALGFTESEERERILDELYEAVTTIVRHRIQKAKSVIGEERE